LGPVRLGIVGCGFVVEGRHLPALRRLSEIEVVALADVDLTRCRDVAARFGVPRCADSVHALIEENELDAVAVCTPASVHAEPALAALEAGKHVFVEKPITLSLEEADLLVDRAARASGTTTVGFNLRYHRLVNEARRLLREGAVGRVTSITTSFTDARVTVPNLPAWRAQRHLGGGALLDRLIHHFDLWRFLLDDEVDEVFAVSRRGSGEDELAHVTARMHGGALVHGFGSDRTSTSNGVAVYGEVGSLHVDLYRFDGLVYSSLRDLPGAPRTRLRRMAASAVQLSRSLGELRSGGLFDATYPTEWRRFAAALRGDGRPASTFEDGRRALQIALAAAESTTLGRPVKAAESSPTVTPVQVTT
jgi:myo-inositol 2-dehydrogenase / D-chiro-inositol 1-dehydrogenase